MKSYEGVFITKAGPADEANQKVLGQIEAEITKNGGKLENTEKWGKRNLAYPIKKNKEGLYYKIDFQIEPGKISELKKIYHLNEEIIRELIIRKE
ncbi:MAG: 30S ribosomal protein S6 [Candidatus Omnitrophica bacterium]|nr:30S ribosomal protein S6 [Candidatus Omnitrophota bacterium]